MSTRSTDPKYVEYQYGDTEKLRIRAETHARYSERPDDWMEWLLDVFAAEPGHRLLDVGCGTGWLHPALSQRGVRIIGLDSSAGMVAAAGQQATLQRLPVAILQADAQALPVADASCDRVIAAHMMFHVPDVTAALREFRRVVRPGGRVVVTTNAADHSQRLHDLHGEAARSLGYTPTPTGAGPFTLDSLDVVREMFPTVECRVRQDAFVFPDAESVLRFYATARVDAIQEWDGSGEHRERLLAAVRDRVEAVIAREGVFRVPKNMGALVANV